MARPRTCADALTSGLIMPLTGQHADVRTSLRGDDSGVAYGDGSPICRCSATPPPDAVASAPVLLSAAALMAPSLAGSNRLRADRVRRGETAHSPLPAALPANGRPACAASVHGHARSDGHPHAHVILTG